MADLLALFLLGVFGSAHCAAMCGPVVLSIPVSEHRLLPHLLYNLGRISTYSLVGLLLGGLGEWLISRTGSSPLLLLHRFEICLSLLAASLLFWLAMVRFSLWREPAWMEGGMITKLPGFRVIHQGVVVDRSPAACYLFGVLMGFLPCGLSYGAFSYALACGSWIWGGLGTMVFGLGTLPSLFFIGTVAGLLLHRHRKLFDFLAGLLLFGMALFLFWNSISRLVRF